MKRVFLMLVLAAVLPFVSRGHLVFNDEFNYADGGLVTNSAGVWLPNSGTMNSMLVKGGQLEVTFARTEDIAVPLPGGPYLTNGPVGSIYTSFKATFAQLPNARGSSFALFTGEQF